MSGSADERAQLLQDDGEPTEEQNSEDEQEYEQEVEQQQEKKQDDEEEPVKINVWNLADVKNACDDQLQKYMTTRAGYKQSHTYTDVKLLIGYVGCAFVLAGGGYTYITSFKEDPQITTACVTIYAVANVLLYLYSLVVEKDIVFVGAPTETIKEQFPEHKLIVSTNTKRYSDVYDVTLEFCKRSSNDSANPKYTISKPFCSWFDETGVLHGEPFEEFLAEGLQVVRSGGKPHVQ